MGVKFSRKAAVAAVVLAAALIGVAVVTNLRTGRAAAAPEDVLPASTIYAVLLDGRWAFDLVRGVCDQDGLREKLSELERDMGVSLEKDVASWAGSLGLVLVDLDMAGPKAVAIAEILDGRAYGAFQEKLCSSIAAKAQSKPEKTSYGGQEVTKVPLAGGMASFAVCQVKGWAVFGVGLDGVEAAGRVVDAAAGRTPSLGASREWGLAKARLPEKPLLTVFSNGGRVAQVLNRALGPGQNKSPAELMDYASLTTWADDAREMRLDTVSVPVSDALRASLKKLGGARPVEGRLLGQFPAATAGLLLLTEIPFYWDSVRGIFKDYEKLMPPSTIPEVRRLVEKVGGVDEVLALLKGECGIGFVFDGVSDPGVLCVAEAVSGEAAARAAENLKKLAGSMDVEVESDGGVYRVSANGPAAAAEIAGDAGPDAADTAEKGGRVAEEGRVEDGAPARGSLLGEIFWTARGNHLVVATSRGLLAAPGSPTGLTLPPDGKGCPLVGTGSLRFLGPLIRKTAEKAGATPETKKMLAAVERSGIDKVELAMYAKIDAAGSWSAVSFRAGAFDWKGCLKALAGLAQAGAGEAAKRAD